MCFFFNPFLARLSVTYQDLRGITEFADVTILAVKAPPDTIVNCDVQEVSREGRGGGGRGGEGR